jgi:hypothetical protein
MWLLSTNRSTRFVRIEQQTESFPRRRIIVSTHQAFIHIDLVCVSVAIRASPPLASLFVEYSDLIQRLGNINNIQMLTDEPTGDQNEYQSIATTTSYTLYFISN